MNDDATGVNPPPNPLAKGQRWYSTYGEWRRHAVVEVASDDDVVFWSYSSTLCRDRLQVMPRTMFVSSHVHLGADGATFPPPSGSWGIFLDENGFRVEEYGEMQAIFPTLAAAGQFALTELF